MSKIVVLTPPAHGHLNPILPVVRELVQRGEQVICYNTDEFRPQIERTGAGFRAYPATDLTSAEISRVLQNGNIAAVTGLILGATEQLLPFVLDELAREAPDLVIFDAVALWGKMAATQLRLRGAASIGLFVMDERQLNARDLLRVLRLALPKLPGILSARRRLVRRYGKAYPSAGPLFPMRDRLNIVYTARELQPDTAIIDETFRFVGPSIDPRSRGEDGLFEGLGQEPVVYISLGTIHSTHTAFFRACFEAFADHRGQFVLSAGKQTDISGLGPIPANFIVRPTVPQLYVLQRADVFITHGGMNSIHEGLYYGVPLILIPHQLEQLFNARCVAARGAGLIIDDYLRHRSIAAAALRQALDTVVSEPSYRGAAMELQQSLRATGGYRQAANEIQAYLAEGAGGSNALDIEARGEPLRHS
jgi:MGT family glycosyltransferase